MREPQLMSLSRMRSIFESQPPQHSEGIFINSEMAILYGNPHVFRLMMKQKPPFCINDYRLGIVTRGSLDTNINLVEKHISAGSLIFIGPGTIISPIRISADLEIFGFALSNSFPMPFTQTTMPTAFNGQVRDFQIPVSEADLLTAHLIVDTLWQVIHQPDYNRSLVSNLVAAQMHHYDSRFLSYTYRQETAHSREQSIFHRFIQLVNQHAVQQHQLTFYAQKLCLTERYLGTVVRHASGITAKEWIDRALIARIQVELRHTGKSVTQIADEMNFPNASFFCKYFKRLTGQTPSDYRL